jgi:hypothetical protein
MATSSKVTKGDAQAVLNAFGGAGKVIRRHGVVQFGTPADPELRATIRPFSEKTFPDSPFNGRHYCADDWHVIVVAEIDGGDHSYSIQDANAALNPLTLTFTLDGAELPTTRTPIKRFDPGPHLDGMEVAYFFQQGAVLSPSDLTVGSHSLSYTERAPGWEYQDAITFVIDPPGHGACA